MWKYGGPTDGCGSDADWGCGGWGASLGRAKASRERFIDRSALQAMEGVGGRTGRAAGRRRAPPTREGEQGAILFG